MCVCVCVCVCEREREREREEGREKERFIIGTQVRTNHLPHSKCFIIFYITNTL